MQPWKYRFEAVDALRNGLIAIAVEGILLAIVISKIGKPVYQDFGQNLLDLVLGIAAFIGIFVVLFSIPDLVRGIKHLLSDDLQR